MEIGWAAANRWSHFVHTCHGRNRSLGGHGDPPNVLRHKPRGIRLSRGLQQSLARGLEQNFDQAGSKFGLER